jgi:hypothetical protein
VFNRSFFAKKVKNDSFGFRCAKDGAKDDETDAAQMPTAVKVKK